MQTQSYNGLRNMYSFERNACVIPSAQTHDVNKKTQQTATWTQAHLNCRWWGKQSRRADTPWNACRCDDAVRVCNGTWLDRATPNCYSRDQRQSTTTPHTRTPSLSTHSSSYFILARTTHVRPKSVPLIISSHNSRFFSTVWSPSQHKIYFT